MQRNLEPDRKIVCQDILGNLLVIAAKEPGKKYFPGNLV